ncbi:MAG: response regulator [Bryobacteraceae bacterium]
MRSVRGPDPHDGTHTGMNDTQAVLDQQSPGTPPRVEAAEQPPRILVVEDDPSIGMMIEEVLSGKQYEVRLVTSPGEALEAVKQQAPDLALMDINLGSDIDGIETVKRMREISDVPVCFITAYSDEATVARAEQVDPMAYLVKPFETGDVGAMVKISLANARRQKAKEQQAARMELAAREAQEAMLFLDAEGHLKSATGAARQLLGWGEGQGIGTPWWESLRASADEGGPHGDGQANGESGPEAILKPLVAKSLGSAEGVTWRGWHRAEDTGAVPVMLSLRAEASLGEVVCRVRKIPAAALRLGQNAAVAPVTAGAPGSTVGRPDGKLEKGALTEMETEDALTGLPNQDAIVARLPQLEIEGLYLFVLFVEHIGVLRQRFGSGAIDRIILSYSQHLAQHLPDECQLARWDGAAFLVLPRPEAGLEIEREVSRVLSAPMLYHLQLSGRSALLRVTSTFTMLRAAGEGSLAEQIEDLMKDHNRR